ncbi:hypothetical protein A2U01_0053826, partial [Trifolium medium]|nr:hypothetical protein [Trifolium medium]
GWDRGDWIEVRSRRRKERREAEEGHHRQREVSRFRNDRQRSLSPWQTRLQDRSRLGVNHRYRDSRFDDHSPYGRRQDMYGVGNSRLQQSYHHRCPTSYQHHDHDGYTGQWIKETQNYKHTGYGNKF